MPKQKVTVGPLTATLRECWIDAGNKRLSAEWPEWTDRPTIHAIVIESVHVEPSERKQGHFRRFLAAVCDLPRFDMVVVEGVQNPDLVAYLHRLGWEYDPEVSDFYSPRKVEAEAAVAD
jgi:hypothetical protein